MFKLLTHAFFVYQLSPKNQQQQQTTLTTTTEKKKLMLRNTY